MKIDTNKGHGYTPCSRRRTPKWGVNGQTKLLFKVSRQTWALRGLFGNRRRLSSSTGSQCPKTQSSLRPIRLPKSDSKFRTFGRSQTIHTPSSVGEQDNSKCRTFQGSRSNTALKQRGSLSIWFDPEMSWHAPPTGKRGRPPAFNDAAIQVCLTMKVLFGMPLRQTTGFVESLLRLAGLDWKVPDFSTLKRRAFNLTHIRLHGSSSSIRLV